MRDRHGNDSTGVVRARSIVVLGSISACIGISQANNGLPLLVCAAVSYTVAGIFTISIYDMFMELGMEAVAIVESRFI